VPIPVAAVFPAPHQLRETRRGLDAKEPPVLRVVAIEHPEAPVEEAVAGGLDHAESPHRQIELLPAELAADASHPHVAIRLPTQAPTDDEEAIFHAREHRHEAVAGR